VIVHRAEVESRVSRIDPAVVDGTAIRDSWIGIIRISGDFLVVESTAA